MINVIIKSILKDIFPINANGAAVEGIFREICSEVHRRICLKSTRQKIQQSDLLQDDAEEHW